MSFKIRLITDISKPNSSSIKAVVIVRSFEMPIIE
jgi:hypothetical protein